MQRAPQVVHGLDGLADVCVDPYGPTEERNTLPALLSNNMKKVRVQGVRSTQSAANKFALWTARGMHYSNQQIKVGPLCPANRRPLRRSRWWCPSEGGGLAAGGGGACERPIHGEATCPSQRIRIRLASPHVQTVD
jgi:hypothetical protein